MRHINFKNWISRLKQAFSPKEDALTQDLQDQTVDTDALVARYSRGNPSLQQAKFNTASDIDTRRRQVCDYDFKLK